MKKCQKKPFWEMNTKELAEATKEFDDPNYDPPGLPVPPEELAKLHRAMRKPGRPRNGLGAKTIALSIERGLLDRVDRLAKKQGITRAQIVAAALQGVLAGRIKLARATSAASAKQRQSSAA